MTAFSDWLHRLPAVQVKALREFRAMARAAYPEDSNYIERALNEGAASSAILAMPREFVLAIERKEP